MTYDETLPDMPCLNPNCGKIAVVYSTTKGRNQEGPVPVPLMEFTGCVDCDIWTRLEESAAVALRPDDVGGMNPWHAFYFGMLINPALQELEQARASINFQRFMDSERGKLLMSSMAEALRSPAKVVDEKAEEGPPETPSP